MHEEQHLGPAPVPCPPCSPRQRMDEALAMLDGLGDRPLAEHVEQFETVHKALVDTLSAIDKD